MQCFKITLLIFAIINQMKETNFEIFFREIKHRNDFHSRVNDIYRKQLALDFNPLDFVRWNENKVSEIIAFFLDPHEAHGQSDLYLRMFIEYFELSFFYSDISKVSVLLEDNTDENRRVDIIVSYDNFKSVIGIENKIYPWTKDQHLQVHDYIKHLESYCKSGKYHLLYLAPKGKVLSEASAGENFDEMLADGKLKLINYEEHLIDLVHRFAMHTDNDRVRSFIKDFELKLRTNYIGDNMSLDNGIVEYIRANEHNIKSAFSVANNLNTLKTVLKTDFYKQMEEISNELNIQFVAEHNHFILPNFNKYYAKFNFEGGGFIYGLVKTPEFYNESPHKMPLPEIARELKTKFKTSYWWPLYRYLYENIEVKDEMWIAIQNGSLKKIIKDFLKSVMALPKELTEGL
ncbi:hypothetical protein GEO21_20810 [Sphingobacterium faecium]|nr:hypothetical protein [Sphingobacterium faecium]